MGNRITITNTDPFDLKFFPFSEFVRIQLQKHHAALGHQWSAWVQIEVENEHAELTAAGIFEKNLNKIKKNVFAAMQKVDFFRNASVLEAMWRVNFFKDSNLRLELDPEEVASHFLTCGTLHRTLFIASLQWLMQKRQREIAENPQQAESFNDDFALEMMPALNFSLVTLDQMQQQLKVIRQWHQDRKVAPYISVNLDWSKVAADGDFARKLPTAYDACTFAMEQSSGDVTLLRSDESFEFVPPHVQEAYQASQHIMGDVHHIKVFPFDNLFELVMIWEHYLKLPELMHLLTDDLCITTLFEEQRELLQYCSTYLQKIMQEIKDAGQKSKMVSYKNTLKWEQKLEQALNQFIAALSLAYQGNGLSFDSDGSKEHDEGALDAFVSGYTQLLAIARAKYKPHMVIQNQTLECETVTQIQELCVVTPEDNEKIVAEKTSNLQQLNSILYVAYHTYRSDSTQVKRQIEQQVKAYHRAVYDPKRYSKYKTEVANLEDAFSKKEKLAPSEPLLILGIPIESLLKLDYRYQRWQFIKSLIEHHRLFTPEEFVTALAFVRYQIKRLLTPTAVLCDSTAHLLKVVDTGIQRFQQQFGVKPTAQGWTNVRNWFVQQSPTNGHQWRMLDSQQAENYSRKLNGDEFTTDLIRQKINTDSDHRAQRQQ